MPSLALWNTVHFMGASKGRIRTAVCWYEKVHVDLTTFLAQDICQDTETHQLVLECVQLLFIDTDV